VESQGLAYSLDRGRSWAKYAGNPVLENPGSRDFRDPKVFWFEGTARWIMTLAAKDQVSFYSSRDLKHWRHESDFGHGWGAHGGVWECPDLIDMRIAGERAHRIVLLSSVNPGAPNGGSGTQYFVGQFDGHSFRPDSDARWLDYGSDDYAGVTWSGVPASDGRTLFLGWMSNWSYAQEVPTEGWRSAMTLPRELQLARTPRGLELHAAPVAELKGLRARSARIAATRIDAPTELVDSALRGAQLLELELALKLNDAGVATLAFRNALGEEALLRIDRPQQRLEFDRSRSGVVGFSDAFARLQTAPLSGDTDRIALHVFLDRSSVEIFVNGGATVLTALVFPHSPYESIMLSADRGIDISSGSVHELHSIWPARAGP